MPIEDPNEKMIAAFENVRAQACHSERLSDVSIIVLAVYAKRDKDDEPRGEAISTRGRPRLSKLRITSLEDRAAGNADARVLLHGDRWGRLSAEMQRSAVDDCLTEIEVLIEDGKTKRDDCGRPKLRRRAPDWEVAGYNEVAERHGKSSLEVQNFRVLFDEHGQTYLPWLGNDEPTDNVLAVTPKRPKALKPTSEAAGATHKRGGLAVGPLRERLQRIEEPATILAVAQLELQSKPRKKVVEALEDRVRELRILISYICITKGEPPPIKLDMAAAVLVTSPANPNTDLLDKLVPECRDPVVLGWIIDDETERGDDARDDVVQVVQARVEELRL